MTNYPAPRLVDLGNPVADHPINRGLVAWWYGLSNNSGGNFWFDIKSNFPQTRTGGSWGSSVLYGQSNQFTGVSTAYAQSATTPVTNVPVTMAAWFFLDNISGLKGIVSAGVGGATDNGSLSLLISGSTARAQTMDTGGLGEVEGVGTLTLAAGVWYHAAAVFASSSDRACYVNGANKGADANTLAVNTLTFSTIGCRAKSTSGTPRANFFAGQIADVSVWNRALSDSEVRALYIEGRSGNPTRLRRYTPAVWSFAVPVPLVHYTLTADTGAFALSGVATGLLAARLTSAGVGSFALAGTAADVRASRVIGGGTGAFALAGLNATLAKNVPLAAGTGTYALNGTDAGLRATRVLTASPATFTTAGTAAGLTIGRVVTAAPAAFTLTGTDAGLRVARTLPATVGTFALSGTDAGLKAARVCTAGTGAFSLAGVDAGLRAARLTSAGTGAFVLSGTDATLSKGRPLAADAGTFALAGQPVGLSRTRRLTAVTGEFGIVGANVTLTYTAIPPSRFGIPGRGAANTTATGRTGGNVATGRASGSLASDGRSGGNSATGRGSGDHAIGGDDGDNDT